MCFLRQYWQKVSGGCKLYKRKENRIETETQVVEKRRLWTLFNLFHSDGPNKIFFFSQLHLSQGFKPKKKKPFLRTFNIRNWWGHRAETPWRVELYTLIIFQNPNTKLKTIWIIELRFSFLALITLLGYFYSVKGTYTGEIEFCTPSVWYIAWKDTLHFSLYLRGCFQCAAWSGALIWIHFMLGLKWIAIAKKKFRNLRNSLTADWNLTSFVL